MEVGCILVVIVLYEEKLQDSLTYKSLVCSLLSDEIANLELFVYDNSPSVNYTASDILFPHTYVHNPLNPGICKAYNEGLVMAREKNKSWLLLFDQDTTVNRDCMLASTKYADYFIDNINVVAIVPRIKNERKINISPCRVTNIGRFQPIKTNVPEILKHRTTALNSGTLLKVDFLNSINGFSPMFPLDMLDHWIFAQIFSQNKKVFCHAEMIEHNLSVYSKQYMEEGRYSRFLVSEKLYYLNEGKLVFSFYKVFLLLRMVDRLMKGQIAISRMTWNSFII